MKNLKKLISVIIAVIMIVGSFATVSAADYKDVESTNSFYKAIKVLSGLGIVNGDDEGNFNPKNDIKRSEMVKLVCYAMGEQDIANNSASNAFADVAANHWAAGYIAWGVNRGIVNGMGDGTFAPDASVSYQDAVVMIMRALGYDRIAQRAQNGGYPAGYLKLASQRGILKDAGYDNQAAAPREVVAQLIYNAMTAPLVDVKQYGMNVEDDRYIIHDGSDEDAPLRTLLTYTNEIIKVKADIVATAKTNSSLVDKEGNYKVNINVTNGYGYTMKQVSEMLLDSEKTSAFEVSGVYVGETEAADLLGATVEAYLVEDEDLNAWKLLAVVADAKSVKSETLKASEVDFTGYVKAKDVVTYEDADANEEEIELVALANLKVYYNGSELKTTEGEGDSIKELITEAGLDALVKAAEEITFTGSRTGNYDKVFITDYDYLKVDSVDAEYLYITGSDVNGNSDALALDAERRGAGQKNFKYAIYDANGKELAIEDIAEGNVLNIVAPKDVDVATGAITGTLRNVLYMDIYVTNNVVTGSVEEEIEKDAKYVVDGKEYEVTTAGIVDLGASGDFFITIDGRIIAADSSKAIAKNFALIVEPLVESRYSGKEVTNYLKIFTAEGKLTTLAVADRLEIVGGDLEESYKDEEIDALFAKDGKLDKLCADDTEANAADKLTKRIATYKVNADNELTTLNFADAETFDAAKNASADYNADINTLAGYDVADSTILFAAKLYGTDEGSDWNIDEKKLKIATFDALDEDKEGGYASILVNFADDSFTLAAGVVYGDITITFAGAHLAVLQSTSSVYDKDLAEAVTKYTFAGATTESLAVAEEATKGAQDAVKKLKVGDVVRYTKDAEGNIEDMEVIYEKGALTSDAKEYTVEDDEFKFVEGYIYKNSNGQMTVVSKSDLAELLKDKTYDADAIRAKFGTGEGNTYVEIDNLDGKDPVAKDITILGSSAALRASNVYEYTKVITVLTEDNRFEDCVVILEKAGK